MSVLPSVVAHNLTLPVTRFIGREREIAQIERLLAGSNRPGPDGRDPFSRLVTLTGVGGCGKTRLALEVARSFTLSSGSTSTDLVFADGVHWVELASLGDPVLVPQTVAMAFDLREASGRNPTNALASALRSQHTLLILDNCEYLVEACAQLAQALLVACPGLAILVTSRTPLRLTGETIFAVPPLETINPDHRLSVANLVQSESVRLFVDRASMVMPAYTLTDHNVQAINQICQRLDGLPLAIELAASWIRVISARDILEQIERSIDFLTSSAPTVAARHRSMRVVLDSSLRLLSEEQRQVFTTLAVFRGSFSREAAQEVAGASLATLSVLVENSLLQRVPDASGATRYQLHELVRQYAFERLEATTDGAGERARQGHLDFFLMLAERAEQAGDTPQETEWLHRLGTEQSNLRAALRWAINSVRSEEALRLNAALFTFWIYATPLNEYSEALERSLSLPWNVESLAATRARAKTLNVAGYAAVWAPNFQRALQHFEEGLALYTRLDDKRGITWSLRGCGFAILLGGDPQRAQPYVEQSLALCREVEDRWGEAWSIYDLGQVAFALGEIERAQPLIVDALRRFREHGILFGVYRAQVLLGDVHRRKARWLEAIGWYAEALNLRRQIRFAQFAADILEGLAEIAVALSSPAVAARLFGAGLGWRETFGQARSFFHEPDYERTLDRAKEQMPKGTWSATYDAGRSLTSEQAVAEALQVAQDLAAIPMAPYPAGLTEREVEVLRLVAKGLSNQEIAGHLVVSARTIHAHLRSIFGKLEVSTRTAAAHEAVRLGLV